MPFSDDPFLAEQADALGSEPRDLTVIPVRFRGNGPTLSIALLAEQADALRSRRSVFTTCRFDSDEAHQL